MISVPEIWMNLQAARDVSQIAHEHGVDIDRQVQTVAAIA